MMRPFPGEEARVAEAARNLEWLFGVAEALDNFWLTHPRDEWIEKSKLPASVVNVAAILDVQASRLFRSVIEECHRCQAFAANIIARSLFETVLALRFLLAHRRLRIAVDQVKTKGGAPKVDSSGNPVYCSKPVDPSTPAALIRWLTRKQRADLYLANACYEDERDSRALATIPGMKRKVRGLSPQFAAAIASWDKELGAEWSSILRSTHSYSGLKVETLAKLLGKTFERLYQTVYHFQSHSVHAFDPFRHFTVTDDRKLRVTYVSSDGELRQALMPAISLFFIVIWTIQRTVGYGPDVDLAYTSLIRRYKAGLRDHRSSS